MMFIFCIIGAILGSAFGPPGCVVGLVIGFTFAFFVQILLDVLSAVLTGLIELATFVCNLPFRVYKREFSALVILSGAIGGTFTLLGLEDAPLSVSLAGCIIGGCIGRIVEQLFSFCESCWSKIFRVVGEFKSAVESRIPEKLKEADLATRLQVTTATLVVGTVAALCASRA
jgi:hypothetical protein